MSASPRASTRLKPAATRRSAAASRRCRRTGSKSSSVWPASTTASTSSKASGSIFEELGQRRTQLERSLAGVETDPDGKTLADRQNALNDFVLQSRQRLGALQETLATLNGFKTELSKSQADLVPLKAPVFGIEALITDVGTTRDLLAKTVGEIEASGDVTLASRVDALTKSKREVEDRLARIFDNFNALDGLRKDIGGIFSTIRSSLNRIG
jgi:hypothetical protein